MIQILLATHNGEKYLRPLLDSLLAQTVQDFQVLVSDDASSDRTTDILQEYSTRFTGKFRMLSSQARGSAQRNFEYLANNAHADYIMFCDQDDVWLPRKIELSLAAIRGAEHRLGPSVPILVHSDLKVVDENLNVLSGSFFEYQHLNHYRISFANLLMQNIVTGCTVIINSALLEIFNSRKLPEKIIMHDWWLALIASAFGRIYFIETPTILYRQHGNNALGAKRWGVKLLASRARELLVLRGGRDILSKVRAQAECFLSNFDNMLDARQSAAARYLACSGEASFLTRKFGIFRHRTLKNGFFRNVALFFVV
jgi:glycosyltransferase involved in cell wall biosynthesis